MGLPIISNSSMESQEENNPANPSKYSITVLFQTGVRYVYEIDATSTVKDLISMIHRDERIEKPRHKRICLLYHGRILPHHTTISEIDTQPEFTMHCFFREKARSRRRLRSQPELRGFDRLTRLNFSPANIEQIRQQFHQMSGSTNRSHDDQLEIEEEWFPAIFNNIDDPLSPFHLRNRDDEQPLVVETNTSDEPFFVQFIVGAAIGFFVGIPSLIFIPCFIQKSNFLLGMSFGITFHFVVAFFVN